MRNATAAPQSSAVRMKPFASMIITPHVRMNAGFVMPVACVVPAGSSAAVISAPLWTCERKITTSCATDGITASVTAAA